MGILGSTHHFHRVMTIVVGSKFLPCWWYFYMNLISWRFYLTNVLSLSFWNFFHYTAFISSMQIARLQYFLLLFPSLFLFYSYPRISDGVNYSLGVRQPVILLLHHLSFCHSETHFSVTYFSSSIWGKDIRYIAFACVPIQCLPYSCSLFIYFIFTGRRIIFMVRKGNYQNFQVL